MILPAAFMPELGFWANIAAAAGALALAGWFWQRSNARPDAEDRTIRRVLAAALLATALWSMLHAARADHPVLQSLVESLRNIGWLAVLYQLFRGPDQQAGAMPVRPVLLVLATVELLHPVLQLIAGAWAATPAMVVATFHIAVLFRLMVAVAALVLVHNAYTGRSAGARAPMQNPVAALAVLWIYDLNYYTVSYLVDGFPSWLMAARSLVPLAMILLLTRAAIQGASMKIRPSRAVAFQSISLLVIGSYLMAMVGIAHSLRIMGDGNERLAQLSFLFATSILALIVLPSQRMRGWLKVTLLKHLFQHRYDYRSEWQRFADTIGRNDGTDGGSPLEQRIIRAVAEITECEAGLLLTRDEEGGLSLAGEWHWRTIDVAQARMSPLATGFFATRDFIIDLDELRGGKDHQGESRHVPDWLIAHDRAWAIVPLLHFGALQGMVVVARPPVSRELDWEDFDLLKVVGRQLASYLAQQASQRALLEAGQFDAFNRRIAFVMHDIKNLASQLSLLARNAERHAENPAFRADMLVTLRNSTDKLNAMIARLSLYGTSAVERLEAVDAPQVVDAVIAAKSIQHSIARGDGAPCKLLANREMLEQVLGHLVQNAIDASSADEPIMIRCASGLSQGSIEVIDTGSGMSVDFLRNQLFKPFASTKPGGFGIGAYEARELVMAMQGRLEVESREGVGSRFTIHLPIAPAFAATVDMPEARKISP